MISRHVADMVINNYFRPTQGGGTAPTPPNTGNTAPSSFGRLEAWSSAGGAVLVLVSVIAGYWWIKRRASR